MAKEREGEPGTSSSTNPGKYQLTERDYQTTVSEYNPRMMVHQTNHCECQPRVRLSDPNLDWETCPDYKRYKMQELEQHNQRSRNEIQRPLHSDTKTQQNVAVQSKIRQKNDPNEENPEQTRTKSPKWEEIEKRYEKNKKK